MSASFRRRLRLASAGVCLGLALFACNARRVQRPYCELETQSGIRVQNFTNKLDLLFLVDNSNSMSPKQKNVFCNFPRLVQELEQVPTGIDLHLAVISPDLGAGATTPPTCARRGGDDGAFQSTPHPGHVDCAMFGGGQAVDTTGCQGPSDGKKFLRYRSSSDNNLGGQDLATAFTCIAALGTGGCGFESQLGAVQRALERAADPLDPQNGGFLREDALLGIVLLTDEDDCSMPPDSLLFDTRDGVSLGSPLGPLNSFRCTEAGVLCDGRRPPREAAELAACVPNEEAAGVSPEHALRAVGDVVAAVQRLKRPEMTIVEAIAGPAPPDGRFAVEMKTYGMDTVPELSPSCGHTGSPFGKGDPAVRIQHFVSAWHPAKRVVSICQPSFAGALGELARRITSKIGDPCLASAPLDVAGRVTADPAAADCTVTEVQGECRVPLPRCGAGTAAPGCLAGAAADYARTCWYLERDPRKPEGEAACPASRFAVKICRGGYDATTGRCAGEAVAAPAGSSVSIQCAACTPSNGGSECTGDGLDNDCDGEVDEDGASCDCS